VVLALGTARGTPPSPAGSTPSRTSSPSRIGVQTPPPSKLAEFVNDWAGQHRRGAAAAGRGLLTNRSEHLPLRLRGTAASGREGSLPRHGMLGSMTRTDKAIPDDESLAALMHASLLNARNLVAASEILLEHRHWPRAYGIATLALEEIGKASLCMTTMIFRYMMAKPSDFWNMFYGHISKIQLGHVMLTIVAAIQNEAKPSDVAEAFGGLERIARTHNATKMRGLYVDHENGTLLEPTDVSEEEARHVVSGVRTYLDHGVLSLDNAPGRDFISYMQDQARQFQGHYDSLAAAHRADPDDFAAGFQEVIAALKRGEEPSWETLPGYINPPWMTDGTE
jgi:AbiV family abortive infection protein